MSGTPDFFYREAQRLGYVARSAFKLLQIQKQYKIITPGSSVLDLGCAPGAWLQVACQNLGPLGKVELSWELILRSVQIIGVCGCAAEQKVKVPSMHCDARVKTVCADQKGFSVILSDMCPLVSGITSRDAALSAELGMRAIDLAVGKAAHDRTVNNAFEEVQSDGSGSSLDIAGVLQPGGHLIIKLLESEDVKGWY
ncbi:UNVERIFIED_CONTAM: Ribosomal RNA large subunit methyltransferase E [Sesamum radiatum]|uniref:rRNA methyltransferase 2, mitochondrial n=1 Tax=Sesamum radiatum TaxID=300843 RepID=A0AAW2TE27_SESRA